MFNYIDNQTSTGNINSELTKGLFKVDSLDKVKNYVEVNDVKDRAFTDFLFGINSSFHPSNVRNNRDVQKITFFTRPQLNMVKDNIALVPELQSLLSSKNSGVLRYIRNMLDPRLKTTEPESTSALIDDGNPFIPIFSNGLKSMSGWPDTVLPTHTSKAGLMKEEQSIADGAIEIYNSFDLNITFRNISDDPITPTIRSWLYYMSKVFSGELMPYIDMVIGDEIDYNTRIYTFVLGEHGSRIKRVACTGASFPINDPTGKYFDITGNNPRTENLDINIRFKCDGAIYNDVRILNDFNKTVAMFNPAARKLIKGEGGHGLTKVSGDFSYNTRFRAIPIIDELNGTLEWYVPDGYVK